MLFHAPDDACREPQLTPAHDERSAVAAERLPSSAMSVPVLSPHAALAERIIGNIVQASSPAVSPDGRQVAFVVTRVDIEKNKYFSQVWLAAADADALDALCNRAANKKASLICAREKVSPSQVISL